MTLLLTCVITFFQEHLFLVCELLRANLYEFQKYNRENGDEPYFTLPRLQRIAHQVTTPAPQHFLPELSFSNDSHSAVTPLATGLCDVNVCFGMLLLVSSASAQGVCTTSQLLLLLQLSAFCVCRAECGS